MASHTPLRLDMANRQASERRLCQYCSEPFYARGIAAHERRCSQRPAPGPVTAALMNAIQRDREAGKFIIAAQIQIS